MSSLQQVLERRIAFFKDLETEERVVAKKLIKSANHHRTYCKKIERELEKLK